MKTKHTPGPWQPSKQHGKPGHCTAAQVFTGHGKELSIATMEPTTDSVEASANAILMAAAPELLEAAIAVLTSLEACQKSRSFCGPLLRKAIKNATR